jgi:hypothetical protein
MNPNERQALEHLQKQMEQFKKVTNDFKGMDLKSLIPNVQRKDSFDVNGTKCDVALLTDGTVSIKFPSAELANSFYESLKC